MNQTPFFQKCIAIYEEELGIPQVPGKKDNAQSPFSKASPFVRESTGLNNTIAEMDTFLHSVQTEYLLWNSRTMSDKAKDSVDSSLKIQLGVVRKQLEQLNKTAEQLNRVTRQSGASLESLRRNLQTMGRYGQNQAVVSDTVCELRLNVVKALGLRLSKVSDEFVTLSSRRMARKRDHDMSYLEKNSGYKVDTEVYEPAVTESYEQLEELPPQQLELLQKENEDLQLQLKNESLQAVSQMESSVVEVSSMVNEISLQLNLQNTNISALANNQEDIMSNVHLGNKQLNKASDRARNSGRNMSLLIMALSCMLLVVDYIL